MHQQRRDPLEGVVMEGRYAVHSRLARGGMSTVYLATDRRLDRRVALKVLYPHLADEAGFVDRFEQEAKSAARLSHPNVVGVLDQGVEVVEGQTVAYLVMEFVEGRTLRDVLREEGRLTPRRALAYLADVTKGLAAAHDAGLIHRDVKPENVLLSNAGAVKIADFGLARAVSATTGTATLVGTVAYLSPELVLGRPAEAQSDIYSTGIMLYELLTGRQPFTGDIPIQVALQHAQADVPAPSALLPGLAPDLDELVLWCTARDPEDRPIDGGALLGELQHIRSTLSAAELDHGSEDRRHEVSDQDQLTAAVVPHLPLVGSPARTPINGPRGGSPAPHAQDRTEVLGRLYGSDRPADSRPAASRHAQDGTTSTGATARSGAVDPADTTDLTGLRDGTGFIERDPAVTRVIGARPAVPPSSPTNGTVRLGAGPTPSERSVATAHPAGTASTSRAGAAPEARPYRDDIPDPRPRPDERSGATARPLSRRQQARQAQRPQKTLQSRTARRSLRVLVVLLLLLAGLVATAGWLFGTGPAGIVSLPDVANVPLSEARAALDEQGLASLSTEEVFDERVLAGLVIGTDPGAFSDIRRYQRVELLVSKGPELFAVPDVVGRSQVTAASVLGSAGLAVGTLTEEYSETTSAGGIISQSVPEGAERRRDSLVDLVVSRGPNPIDVPSVIGLTEDEAIRTLRAAGLQVEVDDGPEYSGTVPAGAVVAQTPTGTAVPRGTTVTVTLSLGPRLVDVPNVFSLPEARAVAALERAGFVVEVDYTFGNAVLGLVAGQSRTGEQPEGTTVRITVT